MIKTGVLWECTLNIRSISIFFILVINNLYLYGGTTKSQHNPISYDTVLFIDSIDAEGYLEANSEYPGLPIRYSEDSIIWIDYVTKTHVTPGSLVYVQTR